LSTEKTLTVIIPGRSEMFFSRTIENILENMRGDTRIIAICDGDWPIHPIQDHSRVSVLHHSESVGQRAATNQGAMLARSKYIMKLDAHCAVDEGFDVKLMEDCEPNWTVIPRIYNLHGFDWQCNACGHRTYQGPMPTQCDKCKESKGHEMVVVWKPRMNRGTDFARFDNNIQFQYWQQYKKRPEAQGDIVDVMCTVGCCWFMERDRFWQLEGMDERHGSWGQFGVETACRAWLSGGRQVTNKKTWISHMFRTQPGFGFPYPISGNAIERARKYSRDFWINGKWDKAIRPLSWILDKFWPVEGWSDQDLEKVKEVERSSGRRARRIAREIS
jgi:glycosyltransferase involved in cell wall biosynthesis